MWRKRDKGEGISTRYLNSNRLLSGLSLSPYHQQKTGLFRNTMIAPATHEHATGQTLKPVYQNQQDQPFPPPWGRALRLPCGSASLRTNGPSPRLLFPRPPRVDRGADPYTRVSARVRLTPLSSLLTFSNFPLSAFRFSNTTSRRPGFSGIQ